MYVSECMDLNIKVTHKKKTRDTCHEVLDQ